jgi:hypothetical protein
MTEQRNEISRERSKLAKPLKERAAETYSL